MIPYKEVISLKTNPKYKYRKEDLFDLQKELNGLMSDLKEEENE